VLERGANSLADYELMELLLARALPRQDVKPIAKDLIATFGGFAEALSAPIDRLCEVKGVKEKTALELKLVQETALRFHRAGVINRPVLSSWTALLDYCRTRLAYQGREEFHLLFLDKKNRLIADEAQSIGTVDHAPVYPREVMHRALALGATALILVHNHPSGDSTPSNADVEMTRKLIAAGKPLNVAVHDHLVIGREGVSSFKALGLL
jgi:DNA repair protein RadC